MKDYYEILGVSPADSAEVIKQAYRRLAKRYHPDLNQGDARAEARFKEIGEAWETLGETEKRKKYDSALAFARSGKSERRPQSAAARGTVNYSDIMSKFGDYFGDDKISQMAQKQSGGAKKNPIDTSAMFEHFMGFKK